MKKYIPLPNWIQWSKAKGHYVTIDPLTCQRCEFVWYPRMDWYGHVKLNMCPNCKSKLWNVPKRQKIKEGNQ